MKRSVAFFGLLLVSVLLISCIGKESDDATKCTSNDECKFNRVCYKGECVFPSEIDGDEESGEAEGNISEQVEGSDEERVCNYAGSVEIGGFVQGDTSNSNNDYTEVSGCLDEELPGNDDMWTISVPAGKSIKINLVASGFDPVLLVLDGCFGECIAGTDEESSKETIVLEPSDSDRELVIVIDSKESSGAGTYMLGISMNE